MTAAQDSRAQFEAFQITELRRIHPISAQAKWSDDDVRRMFLAHTPDAGEYYDRGIQAEWTAWQASRAALSAELTEETEATDNWRRLALQFDGHRMQALWHLKRILHADSSVDEYKAAEAFLEAPPLDGEAVLSQRITALYADAVAAKPLAYLVERHAFRASPHGQDAEGNSWLEECQPTEPGAFPVYAAPQPRAFQTADGAQERKPLTDAQIDDLHGEANRGFDIEHANYLKAFRDAERAHGITGEHST